MATGSQVAPLAQTSDANPSQWDPPLAGRTSGDPLGEPLGPCLVTYVSVWPTMEYSAMHCWSILKSNMYANFSFLDRVGIDLSFQVDDYYNEFKKKQQDSSSSNEHIHEKHFGIETFVKLNDLSEKNYNVNLFEYKI